MKKNKSKYDLSPNTLFWHLIDQIVYELECKKHWLMYPNDDVRRTVDELTKKYDFKWEGIIVPNWQCKEQALLKKKIKNFIKKLSAADWKEIDSVITYDFFQNGSTL